MSTNLTNSKVKDSFQQLLHVDGGPEAAVKPIYSGTGTATALRIGTGSIEVDNIRIDGNTISALTGSVVIPSVDIAGGSITNVAFTGSFTGITLIESQAFHTVNGGNGLEIENTSVVAAGVSTNIDINITPKGTGEVNVTNIDVLSGKVPFNTITNRAYAAFFDAGTTDQTGSTTDRTAVKWATASVAGAGVTVVSDSRITLAAAGTYRINASLQLSNSTNTVRTVDVWFAKNGVNIPSSAARVTAPAANAGGTELVAYEIFETVAAGDYIEMYWYPSDVTATLHYRAPVASNPGVTPAIPATPPAIVVVERVA